MGRYPTPPSKPFDHSISVTPPTLTTLLLVLVHPLGSAALLIVSLLLPAVLALRLRGGGRLGRTPLRLLLSGPAKHTTTTIVCASVLYGRSSLPLINRYD